MTREEHIAEVERYECLADAAAREEALSINSPGYYRKRAEEHRQACALAGHTLGDGR